MSLRFLYRQMPVSRRVCSYYRCQKPILRNIAQDKTGALYHWGCLQSARDEQYECLECASSFDGTEVVLTDYGDKTVVGCPSCGSVNLRSMRGG